MHPQLTEAARQAYWRPHPYDPLHRSGRFSPRNIGMAFYQGQIAQAIGRYFNIGARQYGPALPPGRRKRRRYLRRRAGFTKRVKKIINAEHELKYLDIDFDAYIVPIVGTSVVTPITLCAQGDDINEREGHEILVQSWQFKGSIGTDADAIADTQYRMLLVQARMNIEGGAPTVLEILKSDSCDAIRTIDGLRNNDFKVRLDQRTVIRTQNPPAASRIERQNFSIYYKFKKPIKVTYDDTTAVIGSAEKNHLFLVLMTNQANTFQPALTGTSRITFKDN